MAKQYNIKNFSGMGDDGVYYLEGMSPAKKNGNSILTPSWYIRESINSTDTGFSSMSDELIAVDMIGEIGSVQNGAVGFDRSGKMFCFEVSLSSGHQGLIHDIPVSGDLQPTPTGDIKVTTEGNIIYSSKNHLGIGYRFTATSGTATSLTVSGTDFSALGVGTTTVINKIYNFTTEEEYTITSISGTGNETLNFTAGSNTPSSDDIFIVFVDNKWDLNTGNASFPQFAGQDNTFYWKRKIEIFGENYYILNGNWLAVLDSENSVFSADEKQLPLTVQGTTMSSNDNKLLVCGNGKDSGVMSLWDGAETTIAWNSIKKTDRDIQSIVPYTEGWIALMDSSLIYTNGYTMQKLSTIPDGSRYQDLGNVIFNGMEIVGDKILIAHNYNDYTRRKQGLYIYQIGEGWVFSPVSCDGANPTDNIDVGFIKYLGTQLFISYSCSDGYISEIRETGFGTKVLTYCIELHEKQAISQIKVNASYRYDNYNNNDSIEATITVSIDDGSRPHLNLNQAKDTSTTSRIYLNGTNVSGEVGQEIEILEGVNAGERSFITKVSNAGTSNEIWNIEPVLSNSFNNTAYIQRYNFIKCDSKTIGTIQLNDTLDFNVNRVNTDKLYIEVVITGDMDIDINSLTIK